MGPRVMYLHGLHGGGNSGLRQRLLEQALGRENVAVPALHTRRILLVYTVCLAAFLSLLTMLAIGVVLYWPFLLAVIATASLLSLGVLTYIVTGRGITHYIVCYAVRRAEDAARKFRPNVLVTSSFGAVVALRMRATPRVALVLLAPGQDNYCRYMRLAELPTLAAYPYVIIVHGTCDTEVPLDDSVRLVDSVGYGSCKLELIDDYHSLSTLSAADFREFVDEAYLQARNTIQQLQPAQKAALVGPGKLDPTLFDLGDEEENDGNTEEDAEKDFEKMTRSLSKAPSSPPPDATTAEATPPPGSPGMMSTDERRRSAATTATAAASPPSTAAPVAEKNNNTQEEEGKRETVSIPVSSADNNNEELLS